MIDQEMPKNKSITKGCPKCDMQVPVACKACPCGHTFFTARRTIRPLHMPRVDGEDGTGRRRTERVKREKPNYYDALEYDNQMKKKVTPRSSRSGASSTEEKEEPTPSRGEFLDMEDEEESDNKNSARKRRLRRKVTNEQRVEEQQPQQQQQQPQQQEEEDPMINLSPEKTLQYSIELAEINRKILSASWKPL